MRSIYNWKLPRMPLPLGTRTAVMGILNVTPDSFSDGSTYFDREKALAHGKQMEQDGADIIDVGGESTRPGSEPISEEEETRRVLPVIEGLVRNVRVPISIDTYRATVARRAIEGGAQIVNDISGFRFDDKMPDIVKNAGAGVILMHSRGNREALHKQPRMHDPIQVVSEGLGESVKQAQDAGIPDETIVIDPGIGFGKAADESMQILRNVNVFSKLAFPILIGTSRKSFIRAISPLKAPDWGTAATTVVAILGGVHIVRVHDVRAARIIADITDRIVQN